MPMPMDRSSSVAVRVDMPSQNGSFAAEGRIKWIVRRRHLTVMAVIVIMLVIALPE
jgi:hypothetical protein